MCTSYSVSQGGVPTWTDIDLTTEGLFDEIVHFNAPLVKITQNTLRQFIICKFGILGDAQKLAELQKYTKRIVNNRRQRRAGRRKREEGFIAD